MPCLFFLCHSNGTIIYKAHVLLNLKGNETSCRGNHLIRKVTQYSQSGVLCSFETRAVTPWWPLGKKKLQGKTLEKLLPSFILDVFLTRTPVIPVFIHEVCAATNLTTRWRYLNKIELMFTLMINWTSLKTWKSATRRAKAVSIFYFPITSPYELISPVLTCVC